MKRTSTRDAIVFSLPLLTGWIEVADLQGNQFPINFKRLIGLKITLVKFTYPKGWTGRFLLYPIMALGLD